MVPMLLHPILFIGWAVPRFGTLLIYILYFLFKKMVPMLLRSGLISRTLVGIIDDYFDGYYSEEMIESQVIVPISFLCIFSLCFYVFVVSP